MSLKQIIKNDIENALKAKNELTLLVLRGVNSAIHNKEIEKKGKELTEDDVLAVIISEAKKRKESIEAFEKGGRSDLVEKEKKELEILKRYLNE